MHVPVFGAAIFGSVVSPVSPESTGPGILKTTIFKNCLGPWDILGCLEI